MRWLLLSSLVVLPQAQAAEGGLKLLSFTTLIGEMITFAILVWVVMKFVWPPLMNAIEARQKEIADGLAAAESGRQALASAEQEKASVLEDARAKMNDMVADGEKRRTDIIEAAKLEAETERARIVEQGRREVDADRTAMQRELQSKLGDLVVAGATQVLGREVDAAAHNDIIESLKKSV